MESKQWYLTCAEAGCMECLREARRHGYRLNVVLADAEEVKEAVKASVRPVFVNNMRITGI